MASESGQECDRSPSFSESFLSTCCLSVNSMSIYLDIKDEILKEMVNTPQRFVYLNHMIWQLIEIGQC